MPPIRTPLRNIDSNHRTRGPELTPYQRGIIIRYRNASSSPREIEVELGLSRSTIRTTLKIVPLRDEGKSLLRTSQKLKYTSRARRRILLNL